MQQLFGLDGRVAVVTGASSGLGDRFARVLHGAGATVVVAARRAERLEALAADLGGRVVVVPADLTVAADRERLIEEAFDVAGRIDVLVNNAGYGVPSPAESESIDRFEQTMDINVTAPFHLAQLAGRHMLAADRQHREHRAGVGAGGLGSDQGGQLLRLQGGAVVNLTRQLGCEWGRKGVRVNAIAPGWFPSEMTQAEMFDDEGGQSFIVRNTPMGRAGELAELDGALLYLAGDASTYVTGHILAVDGGWLAR